MAKKYLSWKSPGQKQTNKKNLMNLYRNVQIINTSKGIEHYLNGKSFNRQTLIYMHVHYNMRNQKKIASESVLNYLKNSFEF